MNRDRDQVVASPEPTRVEREIAALPLDRALRSWVIRTMMNQRGIRYEDVAAKLGNSKQAVARIILYGSRGLDRIDDAITTITEERGGLGAVTGSTPASRADMRDLLRERRIERAMTANGSGGKRPDEGQQAHRGVHKGAD